MILSILAILIILGIAYFHWVQGLFSASISMTLAILASALAIGMHEWLATSFLGGALADYANAIMMCVTFAIIYFVGRILFDTLVPGNVSVPLYMDKVGGGVCGLVAALFAVGTLLLAAQTLPFGVAIAGFGRYPVAVSKEVTVPGQRRAADAQVVDALDLEAGKTMPAETAKLGMIVPVDSMVLNFASFQSASGALSGDVDLNSRHPDLLNELFFARLGLEGGAKHAALNLGTKKEISVSKMFTAPSLIQMDSELAQIRHPKFAVEKQLKADANHVILIIRTRVAANATDKDRNFRFSPGSVRLVAGGANYYPVGTLYHPGNVLLANRIDDFIISVGDAEFDLVFYIDRKSALEEPDAKSDLKAKAGSFLEVKRYARVELGGMEIVPTLDAPATDGILRKTQTEDEIKKRLSGAALEEGK